MKITKSQLKRIIKEELESVTAVTEETNPAQQASQSLMQVYNQLYSVINVLKGQRPQTDAVQMATTKLDGLANIIDSVRTGPLRKLGGG